MAGNGLGTRAGNMQGPALPLSIPLDLDFDYGYLSKGKIPRQGETPNLY